LKLHASPRAVAGVVQTFPKSVQMMSIPEAIGVGVWCALRSIVLIIIVVLAVILVYLLIALVLFVCKMPWLGPLLYTIAFPVSVLVMGLTVTGLLLCLMIAFSAMWDGQLSSVLWPKHLRYYVLGLLKQ
jgi:hypothetical protein